MRGREEARVRQEARRRELAVQGAKSARRKTANKLAQVLRLGGQPAEGVRLNELPTGGRCTKCKESGRLFFATSFEPTVPRSTIGAVKIGGWMCATCLWRKYVQKEG